MTRNAGLLALILTAAPAALAAQGRAPAPPAARPEEVTSIDAIVEAVYDVISGPAGVKRDWDRMRSLFIPEARLIPSFRTQAGTIGYRALSVDEYITQVGPQLEERGFFEREIGRVEERYGRIAHLMSAYDSRRGLEDPEPFARGINSFQLMHDGERWWVVTIFWQGESPDNPIPARYLAGAPDDSTAVATVVLAYHEALSRGDSAAALALLAPDAIILESGGRETREEYRAHHLPADIQFARAVPGTRSAIQVRVDGDVAWATSTSETRGTFRDRPINSAGAELMVLARTEAGWLIRAIHWSSRSRRP